MVNRIPLVLDVEDGNKIKELPASDNLNLAENNIVNVQDITALGTINAAIITVNGERLVAQNFLNLTDVPNTYVGSEDYFVKVNETGTGLEFRPIQDIGNLVIDTITISERLEPTADNIVEVGTESNKVAEVWAYGLRGSLVGYDGTLVFDAETNKISYAALQGAPTVLSEFQNDVGYLRLVDLDAQWQALFEGGRAIGGDLVGSVFSNDSVLMVDALESKIRGDIEFNSGTGFIEGEQIAILADTTVDIGEARLVANITPVDAQSGSVGTELLPFAAANFINANIDNINSQQLDLNDNLGIGSLYGTTDLLLDAGNRVKIGKGVPFKVSSVTASERATIAPQAGDIIYNSTEGFIQLYQEDQWINLHRGTFTGNVTTTEGQSDFNDIVVAGNLTVQGTTTSIETTNTDITDNVITLNNGEAGAGVTATTSGIEVDRGSADNRSLVWTENFGGKWIVTDDATFFANRVEANYLFGSLTVETDNLVMGDGDITATGTLTVGGGELVQIVSVSTDIELLPVGKVLVDGNLEVTGNSTVTGSIEAAAFKGTFVGDDSTILVDGVASKIVGDVDNAEVVTTTVQGRASAALNIYRGVGGTVSLGDDTSGDVSVSDSGINITSTAGVDINGAADATVRIGTGATTGNVIISKAGNTTTINGTVNATLTGNVVGEVSGDVTGNIDNTTLTIGATDATTIAIGNSSSTTTINGTIQFTDALIANNLTADDSIVIQTEGNSANEAITVFPKGTDTRINLRADGVNFIGPVVSNIDAIGGVTGDIVGSVFAQDSTMLVNALDGILTGNIDNGAAGTIDTGTLTVGTEIKTTRLTNLTPGITDLDVSFAGTIDIEAGTSNVAGTSSIILDKLGTSYINITSEPSDPNTENALVSINTTGAAGDVQIGTTLSSRDQVVTIYNADVNGVHNGVVNGVVNGSLIGSVFAEDSGTMVDAANYAMFSDTLTLTPLTVEPDNIVDGMIVVADGNQWNPLNSNAQTLMVYLGGSWRQLAVAA